MLIASPALPGYVTPKGQAASASLCPSVLQHRQCSALKSGKQNTGTPLSFAKSTGEDDFCSDFL